MQMATILITFYSLRLNLINTVSGHSKSHSYYFPNKSLLSGIPQLLMSQMTAEDRVTLGCHEAGLRTSLPQSKHTNKSSHANLKGICACRPARSHIHTKAV